MDEIEYTEEEAKKAWEDWLINFIKTEPEIYKLIEWIGDNQVRYDGVKLWKRKWEGNTACYAYKDKVEGDFVLIPKSTVKSDEPILLDGMKFDDLKAQFKVPIYDMDIQDFVKKVLGL